MADSDRNSLSQTFWTGGINSLLRPGAINDQQYAWGENIINRGGIIQTRPGLKLAASILGDKLQGFFIYTPRNSTARLLAAVDGAIYVAEWNTFNFTKIDGLSFSPDVPIIQFCQCLQSTKRNPDNSIALIDPIQIVMIGDGIGAMGMWDGTTATTLDPNPPAYGTPIGLWMAWTASRLWIADGPVMRVSDLGNPTSFFEDTSNGTRSYFQLPDIITGVIETANERGLLVFTERTTTVFQSYITARTTWGSTPDFQKTVFPNIGCDAGRTACNQYGMTYWHSWLGLVSLDAAMNTQHTSKLLAIDTQMIRSKRNLSPDMSGACAVSTDNLLLISVPSGGKHNEQTWVLDQSPLEGLLQTSTTWASIWTGVRPVQWAEGKVGGQKRLYFASYDRTPANNTHIHIWEAMRIDRQDEGGRVSCQVEFPIALDPRLRTFKYAEIELVEILGEVDISVYVKGTRGPWILVSSQHISAEIGSIGSSIQRTLNGSSILQAFKPQSRRIRTQEFKVQDLPDSPENSGMTPGRDKGFGLLIQWKGRMGISDVRMIHDAATESDRGEPDKDETGEVNIVLETGEVIAT